MGREIAPRDPRDQSVRRLPSDYGMLGKRTKVYKVPVETVDITTEVEVLDGLAPDEMKAIESFYAAHGREVPGRNGAAGATIVINRNVINRNVTTTNYAPPADTGGGRKKKKRRKWWRRRQAELPAVTVINTGWGDGSGFAAFCVIALVLAMVVAAVGERRWRDDLTVTTIDNTGRIQTQRIREARAELEPPRSEPHVTMTVPRGDMTVNGQVNGHPVSFVLDTGADAVMLTGQTAEAIGLNLRELDFSHRMIGIGGATRVAHVLLNIDVDGLRAERVEVVVTCPNDGEQANLLGRSFLNKIGRFEYNDGHLKRT